MLPTDQKNAIALFVRNPVPGRVKTRLACDMGDVQACELYQAMVADCIRSAAAVGLPLYLFHDDNDGHGLPSAWMEAAASVVSQVGESLGARMIAAFECLYAAGFEGVVLAGSDIPGIDEALLRSASAAITEYDVVFSPAFDGGYCLVASRKSCFTSLIFRNIAWSTPDVMEQTIEACRSAGLRYSLLERRQDIDTVRDLEAYCQQPCHSARSTNSWLTSHGYALQSATVSTFP